MYENWDKDIRNMINVTGVSVDNINSKKEQIKQEIEKNKDNILYEYVWKDLYFDNNYGGTYIQICSQVSNVILNYLEEEKAIMELISENYMYPVGEIVKSSFYYSFNYQMQGTGVITSGRSGVDIKTIPYKYFRKS
ncbi:hypothetical protein [Clostridium beijerinckii]|uniref:Uncharacterized protein n=1 Tax=Clostridium beijerinckii TaxID=1520 RepID=A0A1S9N9J2_CLOBE|nr:hypothetical protein [Clostridium beijerinckii]OOP74118.1 hypothetical protein CBEIBR21_06365 [Clostridium beijerinckii]